jgi:hypothetical protein
MEKNVQQKITELEKNLANKIKELEEEIKELPASARRKKDEKNWQTFFTYFLFTALVGVVIFGTGGWMAVALTGALLTLIIVESGLFLSVAIGFSAWPLYNAYLWTRDLLSSEKIKDQNKYYDQCVKNLIELKELAAEKNYLSEKINAKLNKAVTCFPSNLLPQVLDNFEQLNLNDQIQRLEQLKENHPAYSRKQKDKKNWKAIFSYSAMVSVLGVGIYFTGFIMMAGIPITLLLGPIVPVLVVIEAISALILVGPIAVSSGLHAAYLWIRDVCSASEIKTENKQYANLEKTIAELKKLEKKLSPLNKTIMSKLQIGSKLPSTPENLSDNAESNNAENEKKDYYKFKLLQKSPVPANQTNMGTHQSSKQSFTKSL